MWHFTAGVAVILPAALWLPGCGCTDEGCWNGAWIEGPISVTSPGEPHLEVTGCRNGHCGSVELASPFPDTVPQGSFAIDGGGFLFNLSSVKPPWSLWGMYQAEKDTLEDGDVYTVRVLDKNNNGTVLDLERKVTYTEHNTEPKTNCGQWCKSTQIHFSFPGTP